MNSPTSPRRAGSLLAAAALAVGAVAVSASSLSAPSRPGTLADLTAHCAEVIRIDGLADSCAHADEAPPGVDVHEPVTTAELMTRAGAAAAAVDAAEDEGIPVAREVAQTTDRVACDGDGTSGYRVQAMYVVTAGSPNRYAQVAPQIKRWAAGVNNVFKLSAAKTGGTREVRYVTTDNGDGTCSPSVLNVTVPAGSLKTLGATITAVRDLGYTSSARKYLMWADGTGQCGIAQTYVDSRPHQANLNNGYAAQFARIDTPCWGQAASVEAHELSHTLGSVQKDAPHATSGGHCYDESDRLCYSDGGTPKAMQQVCAADQEVLFDCNDDDYYSTNPPAGSYLTTHWNTADSRWLIGGGGTPASPAALRASLAVGSPAIAGLPTRASLSLEVPRGRTAKIAWAAKRKDCAFSNPASEQTTITCDAKRLAPTTVTAKVTDSSGATAVRRTRLTFSTTPRPVALSVQVSGCRGSTGVLTGRVVDRATGVGVKGVRVLWLRAGGRSVGTAFTAANGVATSQPIRLTAGRYTASTKATKALRSASSRKGVRVSNASGTCKNLHPSKTSVQTPVAGSATTTTTETVTATTRTTREFTISVPSLAPGVTATRAGLPGRAVDEHTPVTATAS